MKQKLSIRAICAILMIAAFSHGEDPRACVVKNTRQPTTMQIAAPNMHFAPLDMLRW